MVLFSTQEYANVHLVYRKMHCNATPALRKYEKKVLIDILLPNKLKLFIRKLEKQHRYFIKTTKLSDMLTR